MKAKAQFTGGTHVPALRENWQSDYDRPEFDPYLKPKRKLEP
jgi:hypothetical protein